MPGATTVPCACALTLGQQTRNHLSVKRAASATVPRAAVAHLTTAARCHVAAAPFQHAKAGRRWSCEQRHHGSAAGCQTSARGTSSLPVRGLHRHSATRQNTRMAVQAASDAAWEPADKPLPAWRRHVLLSNVELLQRLGWTAALALLIRSGCFIPLPNIGRGGAPAVAGTDKFDVLDFRLTWSPRPTEILDPASALWHTPGQSEYAGVQPEHCRDQLTTCNGSAHRLSQKRSAGTALKCRQDGPAAAQRGGTAGEPVRGRLLALLHGVHLHGAAGRQRQASGPEAVRVLARGRSGGAEKFSPCSAALAAASVHIQRPPLRLGATETTFFLVGCYVKTDANSFIAYDRVVRRSTA